MAAAEDKEVAAPLRSQAEKVASPKATRFEVVILETQLAPPWKDAALCELSYHRLDDSTKAANNLPSQDDEVDKVPPALKKPTKKTEELVLVELDCDSSSKERLD